jgi:two-component system chemotaxis response regulator CheB
VTALVRRAVGVRAARPSGAPEIVVVAASAAASQAAAMFLVGLPERFELPLVLLVGADAEDHRALAVALQAHCALPVREIDDKDPIVAGRIHLAPAGYHVLVDRRAFVLSTDGPVRGARPSVDVLLESVAEVFGERAVCVLLGLAGRGDAGDGRDGAARVRAAGGLVIVQNPLTSTGDAPSGDLDLGSFPAATVLHLSEIAPYVSGLVEGEAS